VPRVRAITIGLLAFGACDVSAQALSPRDLTAIEAVAAEHVARSLPAGSIGFDPGSVAANLPVSRDSARATAIARGLGARIVRTDSVFRCQGWPDTCRLDVEALVRIGEPVTHEAGAMVLVEVRQRSGYARQPVVHGTQELILSKRRGRWIVVGVGRRSVS